MKKNIRFIDLFAGIGGTRIGFENACDELGIKATCVFTSEIKDTAIKVYSDNFNEDNINGDITQINYKTIPDFDFLLGGFPCQPFSSAGHRRGFYDTRGTLFFNIEEILRIKKPLGFLLENVEGLITHDKGNTMKVIMNNLKNLGYNVDYAVLNSKDFGVPQERKRTYIVGHLKKRISLSGVRKTKKQKTLKSILESNKPLLDTEFTKKILSHFDVEELYGKSIKDKRGGQNNIHSWDIEIKGSVNKKQKDILNKLLKERRKKHWAKKKKIDWMDGMPLTIDEILTFIDIEKKELKFLLDDLVHKGYLRYEYPKKMVQTDSGYKKREYDTNGEKGYNIVTGKLSFPINKILDPNSVAPTIVATDANKLAVVDGKGLRLLTIREGLRLFGFPENYKIDLRHDKAFDLLGNTVVVPVIKSVALTILK